VTPLLPALLLLLQAEPGSIRGRVSPEARVRVVAKLAQTDASKPGGVKGEATLEKGGDFEIAGLAPGNYDLLFELQGDDAKRWIANRWSEIVVRAGAATEGISYRLTPAGSDHLIDEVMLEFEETLPPREQVRAVAGLGCRVKRASPGGRRVVVDIPDDRSVAEMVEAFRKLPGVKLAERNGLARIR
jgi:hypothetical protein